MNEKLDLHEIEKANQEKYEEELKANPPKVINELPKKPGEIVFSELKEGDRFQVLTRYLSDIATMLRSLVQLQADEYVLTEFICEKLGIDVKKKKQELVKKLMGDMDKKIEDSKQELEKVKN